jgi:hypothetical protein
MNIKECVDFINFWIRKERGAFYTIEESVEVIDRGQIAYYNDIIPKYATSQIIKDCLSPFRVKYEFIQGDTANGVINIPLFNVSTRFRADFNLGVYNMYFTTGIGNYLSVGDDILVLGATAVNTGTFTVQNIFDAYHIEVLQYVETTTSYVSANIINVNYTGQTNYLDLLSSTIYYPDNGQTHYYPVKMSNEDELANRLNSQIDPVNITSPVGEVISLGQIQLYPQSNLYDGNVVYMRRPLKPVYAYNVIGGRTIEYDAANSTELEWRESDITMVLLKGLSSIGINLSDQEVSSFAQVKSQENYQGVNHL